MQIIPALDIRDGRVVRAAGGDRRSYRPLQTPRFPSCEPADVVRRLSGRFGTFYIADLDAIVGDGDNARRIRRMVREFPDREFWLDAGVRNRADFERAQGIGASCVPIVASETLVETPGDAQLPTALCAEQARFILSLDFGADGLLGAGGLLETPAACWPDTVIALSLAAVGTDAGPDLATVEMVRQRCPKPRPRQRVVAGGGVRNQDDLRRLAHAGADAALVANALYAGALDHLEDDR